MRNYTQMEILEHIPLAPLTTFGIGGPARWFAEAITEEEIVEGVRWAREHDKPLLILGGGSNLLVSDSGFPGLVLHVALRGIESHTQPDGSRLYRAAAGEDWDTFVECTIADNCAGLECLAGIPGTVGGTPVQNVGAYGQEVAFTIASVRALDLETTNFVDLTPADCHFAYRSSLFNTKACGRYIVTRVSYRLQPNGQPSLRYADLQREFAANAAPTLAQVAAAVRRIRQSKGMLLVPDDPNCCSAGSFFRNPVISAAHFQALIAQLGAEPPHYAAPGGAFKLPAAWLIEQAGFPRGFTLGRAAISTRHTLALINCGNATAAEILALRDRITAAVLERFGIPLEMEPVLVGIGSEISGC